MKISDFIKQERKRFNGFVYSTLPFSCGTDEAITHLVKYNFPETVKIERTDKKTDVYLKPLKGSRRKKTLKWSLWID